MPRRQISERLKSRIVAEHVQGGRSVSQLCRQYSVSASALYRWIEAHRQASAVPADASAEELARQLYEARQELESLYGALGRSAAEVGFLQGCLREARLPFRRPSDT